MKDTKPKPDSEALLVRFGWEEGSVGEISVEMDKDTGKIVQVSIKNTAYQSVVLSGAEFQWLLRCLDTATQEVKHSHSPTKFLRKGINDWFDEDSGNSKKKEVSG